MVYVLSSVWYGAMLDRPASAQGELQEVRRRVRVVERLLLPRRERAVLGVRRLRLDEQAVAPDATVAAGRAVRRRASGALGTGGGVLGLQVWLAREPGRPTIAGFF